MLVFVCKNLVAGWEGALPISYLIWKKSDNNSKLGWFFFQFVQYVHFAFIFSINSLRIYWSMFNVHIYTFVISQITLYLLFAHTAHIHTAVAAAAAAKEEWTTKAPCWIHLAHLAKISFGNSSYRAQNSMKINGWVTCRK